MKLEAKRMSRRHQRLTLAAVSMGLFTIGCGHEPNPGPKNIETVQDIRTAVIQVRSVPDEWEAPGTVIAAATAQVAARTMGTVIRIAAKEGDAVKRGQLLAQLDDREMLSRSAGAQAGAQGATARVAQATKAVVAAQAQSRRCAKNV